MQCTVIDKVKYLDTVNIIAAQRWVFGICIFNILVCIQKDQGQQSSSYCLSWIKI
jgi:hypothetical protein